MATTTSTYDSGLLGAILPDFESRYKARVDVIAVGTGQALALGEAGDADVVLVHVREQEDRFVAAGHGLARSAVMVNDFILVGPLSDPAAVQGMASIGEALTTVAAGQSPFASRGDNSGTHSKEQSLWTAVGITPDSRSGWYLSLGQGMGDTLTFANERGAYTLVDRSTFLAQRPSLPNLGIMIGGATINDNRDPALLNPYGVIPVNPDKRGVNGELAAHFVTWLTSVATQEVIADYGRGQYGQPLFYPDSDAWRNR